MRLYVVCRERETTIRSSFDFMNVACAADSGDFSKMGFINLCRDSTSWRGLGGEVLYLRPSVDFVFAPRYA